MPTARQEILLMCEGMQCVQLGLFTDEEVHALHDLAPQNMQSAL